MLRQGIFLVQQWSYKSNATIGCSAVFTDVIVLGSFTVLCSVTLRLLSKNTAVQGTTVRFSAFSSCLLCQVCDAFINNTRVSFVLLLENPRVR